MYRLALIIVILLVVGCGGQFNGMGGTPATPRAVDATLLSRLQRRPSFRKWQPPPPGSMVAWNTLPDEVQEVLKHGRGSPDGRWLAAIWTWYSLPTEMKFAVERGELVLDKLKTGPQLWIAAPDHGIARQLPDFYGFSNDLFLWSLRSTLLYYRVKDDSWLEMEPGTGQVVPFLSAVLKGRFAGDLRLSPDGTRLLYNTGFCHDCNKQGPSPQTTFVVNVDGTGQQQVGIDVDAHWEDGRVVAVPLEPDVVHIWQTMKGPTWTLGRPAHIAASLRAAASVQWRVCTSEERLGRPPLAILEATESKPAVWVLDWPNPPAQPVYLMLFAEVRPGVPDKPYFRHEDTKRWKVLGSFLAKAEG